MIRRDLKSVLYFYLQMIAVWVIAWTLFYFFRHFGIEEFPYIEISARPDRLLHLSIHAGMGLLTGFLYSTSELVFERNWFQKQAYGRLILIKSAVYLIFALLLMSVAVTTFQSIVASGFDLTKLGVWLTSRNFLVLLTYFMIVSIFISFIRQINYKFGPGVLWNMLSGKYHQPSEEDRIFMFLDLKSSTTIAENLGHIRFSRFIQDCFFDLTDVVVNNKVDIYQYVGDEAVLSWPLETGLENNHCVRCYFDFLKVLENRKNYYQKAYGIQPFFKAGIHYGRVTVAEVGVIKREIAYHGDVLNTAARIQGRCNELNQGLLASEDLIDALQLDSHFKALPMGQELLRGKMNSIRLFGITEREGKTIPFEHSH